MTSNDEWSIATPPRLFSPKRQKTESEIAVKIEFMEVPKRHHHMSHVFLLQTILNTMGDDVKALNQRGQVLKASVFPALTEEAVYNNHFNLHVAKKRTSDGPKEKITIIHRFRGISNIGILKKNTKVMEFLRTNRITISKHEWQEEEWDLKVVGFFTNIYPATMTSEYGTKIISNSLKTPVHKQKLPNFRIKSIPVRIKTKGGTVATSAFGLEVRSSDVKELNTVIKENLKPGVFVPFQMKQVNEGAYNKAVEYVASRNTNIWTIVLQYMSEGAFFKLEENLKSLPSVEHVIYDPVGKKARVLVPKTSFHSLRETIKEKLKNWATDLDPDDTREFAAPPEVSHIPKDDFSSEEGSYFTNSIASIMTFEVDEILVKKDQKNHENSQATRTTTTPSEISIPQVIATTTREESEVSTLKAQVATYQKELAIFASRIDTMSTMLELLLKKVDAGNESVEVGSVSTKKDRRQRSPSPEVNFE